MISYLHLELTLLPWIRISVHLTEDQMCHASKTSISYPTWSCVAFCASESIVSLFHLPTMFLSSDSSLKSFARYLVPEIPTLWMHLFYWTKEEGLMNADTSMTLVAGIEQFLSLICMNMYGHSMVNQLCVTLRSWLNTESV